LKRENDYFKTEFNPPFLCFSPLHCRVRGKPKDVKIDEKEVKEVKEEKQSDVVEKIMRAWKDMKTISKVPCIC